MQIHIDIVLVLLYEEKEKEEKEIPQREKYDENTTVSIVDASAYLMVVPITIHITQTYETREFVCRYVLLRTGSYNNLKIQNKFNDLYYF